MNKQQAEYWKQTIEELLQDQEVVVARCCEWEGYKPKVFPRMKVVGAKIRHSEKRYFIDLKMSAMTEYAFLSKISLDHTNQTLKAEAESPSGKILIAVRLSKTISADQIDRWLYLDYHGRI